ncbi:hypothetical protein [Lampropedia puyangensis]|uniref:hypothetical protein n=1 Tax=Lampropedia puyangensis TaxID=1330072 RepID=UPI001B87CEF6|nr:hypothetical protein [Lampropedia puyangensis]
MATQSPFSFLGNLASSLGKSLTLPPWLVEEIQRRMVLMANHVLQQEPQAQERLMTQKDKSVYISWRQFNAQVRITPAGLLDLDSTHSASDLMLEISEQSVSQLLKGAVNGTKPPIRIAGDVALAGELNWVIDNVRWDLEDDLARIIGDVPAHKLAQVGRKVAQELRRFVQGAAATMDGFAAKRHTQAPTSAPVATPAAKGEAPGHSPS